MLRVAWLGTYVQTQHDDHEAVVNEGEIDIVHDQNLGIGEARIAFDAGFTKQFGASVVVPVRFVNTSIRYLRKSDGGEVDLDTPGIHHRNETLVGIADPMLLGSFTTPIGAARVVLRAGFTIPIGETEDNPFTTEAETMAHQHVQMGTGTISPVVAGDVSYASGAWRLGGFLLAQQGIYENDRGFKPGDKYAAGIAVSRRLKKTWSLRGGVEVQGETAEHWNGTEHTDDGNRGRFDAMFTAGGSYAASDRLAFDLSVKVPFITEAVGGQLEMPAIVELGAAYRFGKAAPKKEAHDHGDEHEHEGEGHAHEGEGHAHEAHGHDEHAHDEHGHDEHGHDAHGDKPVVDKPGDKPAVDKPVGDKPVADKPVVDKPGDKPVVDKPVADKPPVATTTKPDIRDYNKPGEAPDLVPVKGKVTIFDFWATWCKPCKALDAALVELAKKHPDVVAIRKLDVVDWDSKAAERYLTPGGFSELPHLKIYDATGKRVLEKSTSAGKLDELIADAKKIVEAEAKKRPKAVVKPTRVDITADSKGFTPSTFSVPRGVPVTLRFTRTVDKNCAHEVIVELDGKSIETKLPIDQPVDVTLTFTKPGTVAFRCAMNMYTGTITVR